MTYTVHTTSKFDRDIKRCKKRHLDINLLLETVETVSYTHLDEYKRQVAKITPEGLSETQESATQMVNEIHKLLNTL